MVNSNNANERFRTLAPIDYAVRVTTSKAKTSAGTDDTVSINIKGSKAETQWRKLDNSWKDDFERGKTDSFKVSAINLGTLLACSLKKTGSDDWLVDKVEVDGPFGTSVFNFGGNSVTESGITVDKAPIVREPLPEIPDKMEPISQVPVSQESVSQEPRPAPVIRTKYRGVVCTGDKMGAGTDAKVSIWVTDVNGKIAGPLAIQEVGGDAMERGQTNEIEINLLDVMGDLHKVDIMQDGSKLGDDWLLNRIELTRVQMTPDGSAELGKLSQIIIMRIKIMMKTIFLIKKIVIIL